MICPMAVSRRRRRRHSFIAHFLRLSQTEKERIMPRREEEREKRRGVAFAFHIRIPQFRPENRYNFPLGQVRVYRYIMPPVWFSIWKFQYLSISLNSITLKEPPHFGAVPVLGNHISSLNLVKYDDSEAWYKTQVPLRRTTYIQCREQISSAVVHCGVWHGNWRKHDASDSAPSPPLTPLPFPLAAKPNGFWPSL